MNEERRLHRACYQLKPHIIKSCLERNSNLVESFWLEDIIISDSPNTEKIAECCYLFFDRGIFFTEEQIRWYKAHWLPMFTRYENILRMWKLRQL